MFLGTPLALLSGLCCIRGEGCLGREINEISTPTARVQCTLYRGGSDVATRGLDSPCVPGDSTGSAEWALLHKRGGVFGKRD